MSHLGCLGDLQEDGPLRVERVVALGLGQSPRNYVSVEEVAHQSVRGRPVAAVVDGVMVRAQLDLIRVVQPTGRTQAHRQ